MRKINKKNSKGDALKTYGEKLTNLYLATKAELRGRMTAKEYMTLSNYTDKLEESNRKLRKENKNLEGKISLLLDIIDVMLLFRVTRKVVRIIEPLFNLRFF